MLRERKIIPWLLIFWFLLLAIALFSQWPDQHLHLVFCDVGQGDAILIAQGSNQVLIDGGPPSSSGRLLRCLRQQIPFWDQKIEVVINTHPEEDHLGGLVSVLRRYQVGWFFNNGLANGNSRLFQELKKIITEHKICSKKLVVGDRFRVGEMYFETVWPEAASKNALQALPKKFFGPDNHCPQPEFQKVADSLNNYSVVLHLKFGQFDALLTGDIPAEVERILAWRQGLPQVEVLKIAHHGSKTSTSEELLNVTQPQLAIISVGKNKFGHPNQEVLERLERAQIRYLRTDQQGTIELIASREFWYDRSNYGGKENTY